MTLPAQTHPWYREPWPWLLMAGPVAVIVAGAVTVWLAIASSDGLVVDDYYKQGLAVNQVLSRDAAASALGYRARLSVSGGAGAHRVTITMNQAPRAEHLVLRVVHPTRPGRDFAVPLAARGNVYEAAFPPLVAGRWRVVLEDRERTWRLAGELRLPGAMTAELTAREP